MAKYDTLPIVEETADGILRRGLPTFAEIRVKMHGRVVCTVCGAEDTGDRPDCPEDGVHCNIVERD